MGFWQSGNWHFFAIVYYVGYALHASSAGQKHTRVLVSKNKKGTQGLAVTQEGRRMASQASHDYRNAS